MLERQQVSTKLRGVLLTKHLELNEGSPTCVDRSTMSDTFFHGIGDQFFIGYFASLAIPVGYEVSPLNLKLGPKVMYPSIIDNFKQQRTA
eukprot:jgi/Botrbrau1/6556/Bobra.40_2s0022.2